MKERCSCGAEFKYYRGEALPDERLERVYEMLKDWRENHRHEMPAAEPEDEHAEAPHIFESQGASVERSYYVEHDWDRPMVTLGFQRNEVR